MNRDFKGIWIPKEIWLCEGLSLLAKSVWAEIHSLYSEEHDGCYASNEYLADFAGVKERRLQEVLAELRDKGLIEYVAFNGRLRILKAILPTQKSARQRCGKAHSRGAEKCTPRVQKSAPPSQEDIPYRDKRRDISIEKEKSNKKESAQMRASRKIQPPSSVEGGSAPPRLRRVPPRQLFLLFLKNHLLKKKKPINAL